MWVRATSLIQRTPEDLYAIWRAIENAPLWQEQVHAVVVTGPVTSRWTLKEGDKTVSWNSEILTDESGKRIAWRTVDGDFEEAGEVIFDPAPGNRGTTVVVLMAFKIGKLASAWESLVGRNPKQGVIENLRHFKALAETGEIPQSQSAPHGKRGLIGEIKRSLYGETIPAPAGTTTK
jgi:uncharacterized membrane protein